MIWHCVTIYLIMVSLHNYKHDFSFRLGSFWFYFSDIRALSTFCILEAWRSHAQGGAQPGNLQQSDPKDAGEPADHGVLSQGPRLRQQSPGGGASGDLQESAPAAGRESPLVLTPSRHSCTGWAVQRTVLTGPRSVLRSRDGEQTWSWDRVS